MQWLHVYPPVIHLTRVIHTSALLRYPSLFPPPQPGSLVDASLQKYMDMGFTRDQVALGIVYCQHAKLKETEVVDFANSYRELTSMGYNPLLAAGALLKSGNELAAATETCLAISS